MKIARQGDRWAALSLLPRHALITTGPVDHADWSYRDGLIGSVIRRRFSMVGRLLPARVPRLLEIGYGSGIFMPRLALHARELHGIDIHTRHKEVQAVLARHGVIASLKSGDVASLPYGDRAFDVIVAVSTLEFIEDLRNATNEMCRVLTPSGFLIMVTPGSSRLLDALLYFATGESASRDYGSRRQHVMPTLLKRFRVDRELVFPPLLGSIAPVYRACRLVPLPALT